MIQFKNDIFEIALGVTLVINAVISGLLVIYTFVQTLLPLIGG